MMGRQKSDQGQLRYNRARRRFRFAECALVSRHGKGYAD